MDLKNILRKATEDNGNEILESTELHRTPGVAEALFGYPAVYAVLAKAAASGTIKRLVASGLWDDGARRMAEKFVVHTGFQPELVDYVLRAAASAAGIDTGKDDTPIQTVRPNSSSVSSGENDNTEEPEAAYGVSGGENPGWKRTDTMTEKTRFITSIIETDTEMESELGVTARYPFCTKADEGVIYLSLEISRTAPMATGALWIALYDMGGAIIFHGLAAALTLSSPSRLPVTLRLPCAPATLSRILLYWH